jgi:hypothetical protein
VIITVSGAASITSHHACVAMPSFVSAPEISKARRPSTVSSSRTGDSMPRRFQVAMPSASACA